MTDFPMMPLWINDLTGDTQHLSDGEFGSYMLLLIAMWRSGGWVPNDDRYLGRICRSEWQTIRPILSPFLKHSEDGQLLSQKRLLIELDKSSRLRERQRELANRRWGKAGEPKSRDRFTDAKAMPATRARAQADATDMPTRAQADAIDDAIDRAMALPRLREAMPPHMPAQEDAAAMPSSPSPYERADALSRARADAREREPEITGKGTEEEEHDQSDTSLWGRLQASQRG